MYTYLSQHTYSLVAFSCFCIYYFLRCVIQLFVIPCESSGEGGGMKRICVDIGGSKVYCFSNLDTLRFSKGHCAVCFWAQVLQVHCQTMHPASTTILVKKEIQFYRWPQEMVYQGPSDGSWVTVGDQWLLQ